MEHLLVGDEQKRKTESKNAKKDDPRAANSSIPWVWLLKRGKRSFWMQKRPPFRHSYNLVQGWLAQASPARPGELTCTFFFFLRGTLTMSPPFSWISILPNLNLLRLELGVDYLFFYFLKQTNSKRKLQNTKDTGLPCSDILCLFRTKKGQRSVGRDPIPTCIRP